MAGRATSYWTPEARYGAKGRALLQRAAASGQYPLSSCRESRQRSTPVSEKIRLCSSRVGLTDSPEAPLLGELANEVRLRGCTKTEPDREPLLDSTSPSRLTPCHLPYRGEALAVPAKWTVSPEALPLGATASTAASGGNREELLGPRPAGCERQRSRRWEPQPGLGERSETERASPSPESRRTAINCLFDRAMLSLRLFLSVSVLALSVTFGDSSPKGRA